MAKYKSTTCENISCIELICIIYWTIFCIICVDIFVSLLINYPMCFSASIAINSHIVAILIENKLVSHFLIHSVSLCHICHTMSEFCGTICHHCSNSMEALVYPFYPLRFPFPPIMGRRFLLVQKLEKDIEKVYTEKKLL